MKTFLRYAIILAFTTLLLWLSIGSIEVGEGQNRWDFISGIWGRSNFLFLLLSAFVAIWSHWIRAIRWKLLLHPMGYPLKSLPSFLSVMVGYFINLVIPRGGEVSRCVNLYKIDGTPINRSLGTVMAERVLDLFFLISFIAVSFLIELEKLTYFFSTYSFGKGQEEAGEGYGVFVWIAGIGLVAAGFSYLIFRLALKKKAMLVKRLLVKVRALFLGLKEGLLVVFQLKKRWLFIFYSLLIWLLYYLMSYFVMMAFPETEHLGMLAALSIFVIGGIAMALPLPGGAGSYHVLVPAGLVLLYGIEQNKAVGFTVIFHGWQTLILILLGAIALVWSQMLYKSQKKNGN